MKNSVMNKLCFLALCFLINSFCFGSEESPSYEFNFSFEGKKLIHITLNGESAPAFDAVKEVFGKMLETSSISIARGSFVEKYDQGAMLHAFVEYTKSLPEHEAGLLAGLTFSLLHDLPRAITKKGESDGCNPLHKAAYFGNFFAIKTLLRLAAIVESEMNSEQRRSAWADSFYYLNAGVSRYVDTAACLNGGNSIRAYGSGDTALHIAAQRGHCEIVFALIVAGASVHLKNVYSYTPLDSMLAQKGDLTERDCEIMRLLIQAGAPLGMRYPNDSLLHLAVERGSVEAVRILLNAGARLNEHNVVGRTPLDYAIDAAWYASHSEKKRNCEAIVQLLKSRGAKKSGCCCIC